MTASKPNRKVTGEKKAVSFCSSCYFQPASEDVRVDHTESSLQSATRRRYHRRGSKTANMLKAAQRCIQDLQTKSGLNSAGGVAVHSMSFRDSEGGIGTSPSKPYCPRGSESEMKFGYLQGKHKQRRLSIISALRLNLERSAVIDPATTERIRTASLEQKRKLTLDILSRV